MPAWNDAVRLLIVIGIALAVFLVAFIIEALRKLLFKYARIDMLTDQLGKKIQGEI